VSESRQQDLFNLEPEPTAWEVAAEADQLYAQVVLNRPLDTVYNYIVPGELRDIIEAGQRVRVPFGRGDTLTLGYCVGLSSDAGTGKKLKSVAEICDRRPLLTATMLELTQWISERYLASWGQVLESVIPAGVKKQSGTREIAFYSLAPGTDFSAIKLPKKQQAVVNVLLAEGTAVRVDRLSELADCGVSPIESLRKKSHIIPERRRLHVAEIDEDEIVLQADLKLNSEQQVALDEILSALREQRHDTFLMRGVTGSGKTEVYIQAIREVVSYGRQAIVLVPEISLTPQTIRRFRARFKSVAVLHSHLSDSDRHWHWQQIAQGDVEVIVGARSAVFAPTPNLGLIVIDEEHETTFKQHSTPRYHAREVARERAKREKIPLLLGSATPTLESLFRTEQKLDTLLTLNNRVESRPLPPVHVVDIRNDPLIAKRHSLGRAMQNGIKTAIESGGQTILFLNLRGFSPVLWCGKCGGVKCPDCDITLTWHKDRELMLCHSCEFAMESPERCPTCDQPALRFLGAGTQRLEAEVKSKFPQATVVRMDSDSMRKPGSHDEVLTRFRDGKIDILLGTQMIAKGLDFPNVTLVGVIDADTLLSQPDLRASERTFQLIAQVAGRTGRGEKEGRVLVQTMSPDEPVIQLAALHDYLGFAKLEMEHRQVANAPPFTTMARIILRSLNEELVQAEARRIVKMLRGIIKEQGLPIRLLGPAPAPILRLRKYFRFHFQLSSAKIADILQLWKTARSQLKPHADVEMAIDVDPMDMR